MFGYSLQTLKLPERPRVVAASLLSQPLSRINLRYSYSSKNLRHSDGRHHLSMPQAIMIDAFTAGSSN
jgi:hypothetical protein